MEKSWYTSKKFWAFAITEALLFSLAMTALFKQPNLGWPLAAFMLSIVITMGAVAFGFNLSQAKLDSYVRGMAMQSGLNPWQSTSKGVAEVWVNERSNHASPPVPVPSTIPPPAPDDDFLSFEYDDIEGEG